MAQSLSLRKRTFAGLAQFLVALGAMLFLPAWSLRYWEGWVLWFEFSVLVTLITIYFLYKDPALIERRLKAGPLAEKEKRQKIIQWFANFFFVVLIIFPGIDHHFGWSHLSLRLIVLGDTLVALGLTVIFFVFRENSYTFRRDRGGQRTDGYIDRPLPLGPSPDVCGSHPIDTGNPSRARVMVGTFALRTHGCRDSLAAYR